MQIVRQFYLHLPSNGDHIHHPGNRPEHYRIQLPNPIDLRTNGGGRWEVGLTEITMPRRMWTIRPPDDRIIIRDVMGVTNYSVLDTMLEPGTRTTPDPRREFRLDFDASTGRYALSVLHAGDVLSLDPVTAFKMGFTELSSLVDSDETSDYTIRSTTLERARFMAVVEPPNTATDPSKMWRVTVRHRTGWRPMQHGSDKIIPLEPASYQTPLALQQGIERSLMHHPEVKLELNEFGMFRWRILNPANANLALGTIFEEAMVTDPNYTFGSRAITSHPDLETLAMKVGPLTALYMGGALAPVLGMPFPFTISPTLDAFFPPALHRGIPYINVSCSAVQPVLVGNVYYPLLRTIPQDPHHHVFDNPLYLPVTSIPFLATIELQLWDHRFRPLTFTHGPTYIVLHFRLCK